MTERIVVPYNNPDLDGVACALTVAAVYPEWKAGMCGDLDSETKMAISKLGLNGPDKVESFEKFDEIWLVDTHHVNQLIPDFPVEKVIKVTDHHTGGDIRIFSNATIVNERVGAAATLLSEDILDSRIDVEESIVMLLQLAIASNTLNFKAPATDSRDVKAYRALSKICSVSEDLLSLLQAERSKVIELPTLELVESDSKQFEFRGQKLLISQVEAEFALRLLDRPNLEAALAEAMERDGSNDVIINVVDLSAGASAIVGIAPKTVAYFAEKLNVPKEHPTRISLPRIIQRKTDIVPHLGEV